MVAVDNLEENEQFKKKIESEVLFSFLYFTSLNLLLWACFIKYEFGNVTNLLDKLILWEFLAT